jgi:hypothetical protein
VSVEDVDVTLQLRLFSQPHPSLSGSDAAEVQAGVPLDVLV